MALLLLYMINKTNTQGTKKKSITACTLSSGKMKYKHAERYNISTVHNVRACELNSYRDQIILKYNRTKPYLKGRLLFILSQNYLTLNIHRRWKKVTAEVYY